MILARLQRFVEVTGQALELFAGTWRYSPRIFFRWREVIRQMWIIGVESLPLTCFFLFLIGMVSTLQVGVEVAKIGQEDYIGEFVAAGMVRGLGPFMTAFVLLARNGSSMAAEIGTMAVSEEIPALRIMSINPVDYIAMPRMVAFSIMGPLLTVFATVVGILGGLAVATLQLNVQADTFFIRVEHGLAPPLMMYWALLKAFIYSVTIASIACTMGLNATGGALGVGRASRNTVVYSLVLIILLEFMLSSFYQFVQAFLEAKT